MPACHIMNIVCQGNENSIASCSTIQSICQLAKCSDNLSSALTRWPDLLCCQKPVLKTVHQHQINHCLWSYRAARGKMTRSSRCCCNRLRNPLSTKEPSYKDWTYHPGPNQVQRLNSGGKQKLFYWHWVSIYTQEPVLSSCCRLIDIWLIRLALIIMSPFIDLSACN